MATPDDSTDAQTQAPPAATSPDMLAQAMALAKQFMPQPVQQDTTPVKRSWTSLLGEALGGGPPVSGMTDTDRELAGHQALMQFGTGLMAASRYQPGQTIFSNLAGGFQGAKQGEIGAEEMAMSRLGAQQEYAQQQAQNKLEALKTALPFLQLQTRQGLPSPFAQGGGGNAPGTNVATGGSIADPAAALPKDQALAAVVQRESGGKNIPTAILGPDGKPASTASGYYQMLDGTWQEAAAAAGIKNPPARAMDASKADQDAAASALYDKYKLMPWAKSAPVAPTTTAAALPATATPPAPYKVASTGPIPPPPSGASTAPATATPAADDTFFPNAPSAAAAPQQPSQADQPPAPPAVTTPPPAAPLDIKSAPDTTLTPEQYTLKHWTPLTPEEVARYAPGPENQLAVDRAAQVQAAQNAANAAKQTYLNVQSGRVPGDLNKSLSDMNTANGQLAAAEKDYNTAVQGLKTEGAKNLLAADDQQRQQLRGDFKSIVTDPAQKAIELAQTAAENEKNRQAEIEKARVQLGLNIEQKGAEAGLAESQQTLTDMSKASTEARAAGNQLRLMPGIVDQLPQPGFAAQLAKDHPALIPWLTQAGALSPEQADATQVMRGLVGYMSVGLRPTGSGALRNAEMDRFQAVLPDLMQSPQGRKDSLSLLQTLQDRIVQEHDFASRYFRRPAPTTGKPSYNLDGLPDAIDAPRSQGGLGPIAPTGPQPVTTDANGQARRMTPQEVQQWVHDNVGVGHAYWGWAPVGDGTYKQKLMVRRDHG